MEFACLPANMVEGWGFYTSILSESDENPVAVSGQGYQQHQEPTKITTAAFTSGGFLQVANWSFAPEKVRFTLRSLA